MNFPEKEKHALKIIREALGFGRITVACSFGKDSVVTVDLVRRVKPDIDIFTVMTPFKFKETRDYMQFMVKHWGINIRHFIRNEGPVGLWETDPDKCCEYYKVEPTMEALEGYDAWITGLRRTEGWTRENLDYVELGKRPVKINPILDWTETDIWRYFAFNRLPVHPLYARGYRSLGCEPCSTKPDDSQPERAGRWKGTYKCGGECGIHSRDVMVSEAGKAI
ncbi:MAG: phosphoadenylyl-sulfate reductase [Nitrospinota bacterium]